ncbi:ABC transporter ATP-binding protein/permease [Kibdelosporangium philippinense]|uniref:ABC transporter ATP-binding protein/permease n=1 Tax=Kibdelosporangium philippinense TaxID=211113 RepID=A0ABS8Z6D1_9PSEU|nr:ABC transporter ATP-binding protein [Kibdelosporangium philippinense]MCE7001422.1 ABC transporter ATP-binding protein/permease [Kibdelosporangium philippinense]
MKREIQFGVAALRAGPAWALIGWSIPEALPAAVSGFAVANAVDHGFLAGRPVAGFGWLAVMMLAAVIGSAGSRRVFQRLGELVEPFRDDLVRRVVGSALYKGVSGQPDEGALARLTRQVEVVRDTYAGLIVVIRGFLVTVVGVVIGLLSLAPVVVLLILPPFLLGFGAFLATLGFAAAKQRASVLADEKLAATAGTVLAGTRDLVACGAEDYAAAMVSGPIQDQASAERALAKVAALRTMCFAIGGWLPLVVLLVAGPWLAGQGLTAGLIMGGLMYVVSGLQPALQAVIAGIGGSGLRFVVTLGRILDETTIPPVEVPDEHERQGENLIMRDVRFAYGPHAEPVLRDLDLTVLPGEHLAVVGPSGIGKSTLASLICGLREPDMGSIRYGRVPAADLNARDRVLIPQEAYVFAGPLRDNLTYLRPDATDSQIRAAIDAVGARDLVEKIGDQLDPVGLSAGQRQLIALVRAYLSPARLVVLDEATCHLDAVAERRAEEAFVQREGTLIVVAHRISSARRAERILVLDGVTAEVGDHASLVRRSPLYRDLWGHWSQPTRFPHDPDGIDASAGAGLAHHLGQVIPHGSLGQRQPGGDLRSGGTVGG